MDRLGRFLQAGATRERVPGVWDCAAFVAEWVVACGHSDPMDAWRGTYDTEQGGEGIAERAGGLTAVFAQGMEAAGVPPVSAPWRAGDAAVVSILGREAGAIFTGRRWSFVAIRGLAFASLDAECVLRVWRPRCDG